MEKLLKIKGCLECKHCDRIPDRLFSPSNMTHEVLYCSKELKIIDAKFFPDWCTLPNTKDEE